MFAFALWDSRRRRLLLARDRIGKKPLFYAVRGGVLSFASELRALLQDPDVPREVDHAGDRRYLAYGYVPRPDERLPRRPQAPPGAPPRLPGRRARRSSATGASTISQARRRRRSGARTSRSGPRCARPCARRLIADVPVGAFLSGGIDSSAVVAAMAEQSSEPVKTFSIGFATRRSTSFPRARLVAERFATDHHELVVEPDAVELLPEARAPLRRAVRRPLGAAVLLPRRAGPAPRTVALNGDGGDESFAGYQRYTSNMLAARLEGFPASLRRAIAAAAGEARRTARPPRSRAPVRSASAPASPGERQARYLRQMSVFWRDERSDALHAGVRPAGSSAAARRDAAASRGARPAGDELLDQLLEIDATVYLPGDLLTKIDIATMAYLARGSLALLDHEFMEFAASIPSRVQGERNPAEDRPEAGPTGAGCRTRPSMGPSRGSSSRWLRWLRTDLAPFTREVLLDRECTDRGWMRRTAWRS